jgi:hypothetical protein
LLGRLRLGLIASPAFVSSRFNSSRSAVRIDLGVVAFVVWERGEFAITA